MMSNGMMPSLVKSARPLCRCIYDIGGVDHGRGVRAVRDGIVRPLAVVAIHLEPVRKIVRKLTFAFASCERHTIEISQG